MSEEPGDREVNGDEAKRSRLPRPTWWVVFSRELRDLWIGGRALNLTLIFAVVLGVIAYVLASNSELSLIPPKEMAYLMLQQALGVGLLISLIMGADSVSGERERATLEALLLTPTSRRQLVVGKFLAGMSPWPVFLAVSVPYLAVLSQGDEVLRHALTWGAVLGSLLALAFTAFGMLVSIWASSNKTAMFVSLIVYVLMILPTTFPGTAQTGAMGRLFKRLNPMESVGHFLEKVLVNNRTLAEFKSWLWSPVLFAVLVLTLLFFVAGPRLRLEGGKASMVRSRRRRAVASSASASLVLFLLAVPALAQQEESVARPALQISIDQDSRVVKNGDTVLFNTTVTNNGTENSPPLIVAMNIINLDGKGDPVDPEDWSPQRTQAVDSLAAGASANSSWRVNTILEGNYMVYMVVIPVPRTPEATSRPVSSSGIHVTVTPFRRLNPGGVLPYAIATPIVLAIGTAFVLRRRRRRIDTGGS